jgi:hypothetical protein
MLNHRSLRFKGVLQLPSIALFDPGCQFVDNALGIQIAHITPGFRKSFLGMSTVTVEQNIPAASIVFYTVTEKRHGDELACEIALGSRPIYFGHVFETLKGQPKGALLAAYAQQWRPKVSDATPLSTRPRVMNSFVCLDEESIPRVARLNYYDKQRASEDPDMVTMSYAKNGWVMSERDVTSADWAYPGERIGVYIIDRP